MIPSYNEFLSRREPTGVGLGGEGSPAGCPEVCKYIIGFSVKKARLKTPQIIGVFFGSATGNRTLICWLRTNRPNH